MTAIYWFRQDLRVHDNPALSQACLAHDRLLPVILTEQQHTTPTVWGFARCGPHRRAFEAQAHSGLAAHLKRLGSALYQPTQPGLSGLLQLAEALSIKRVYCESIHAPEEQAQLEQLRSAGLIVIHLDQSSLLPTEGLPFPVDRAPVVFTAFRNAIERANVRPKTPLPAPQKLPPLPQAVPSELAVPWRDLALAPPQDPRSAFPFAQAGWAGNETTALGHVERYFGSDLPQRYKATRNELIGTDYSTKLSPWLAVGALSPRVVWQALTSHEARAGASESTYWIWFELLWRDHFRLMMRQFGHRLFLRHGLASPSSGAVNRHDPAALQRWIDGRTGEPFVDAGMRELAATGYLSNRMRQNVASFLVHQLGGDWRAGAAWFEHALIDYDVHSNQGNWAYIAGVGTDPRGGRQFNMAKQAHDYDRQGHYRALWKSS